MRNLPTWRQQLYNLVIPRLCIFGERSLPDADTQVLPTHGIEIGVIPNAGHGMMWDNPAAFVQVVARFVARHVSSEAAAQASTSPCAAALSSISR